MIYECTIKNPKKIRAFWVDRAEHAAKTLKLPLPPLEKMTTEQIQKYTESLWKIIEESEVNYDKVLKFMWKLLKEVE